MLAPAPDGSARKIGELRPEDVLYSDGCGSASEGCSGVDGVCAVVLAGCMMGLMTRDSLSQL